MRNLILVLMLALAGCNQGTNNVPYSDPALVAKVDALTKAVADATHNQAEQAKKFSSLQLIGKTSTQVDMAGTAINQFGPCTDMGVLLGRGVASSSSDPLSAPIESFETCTGYAYSVVVGTTQIATGPRIFFDGPNCTGNMLEWTSGGGAYNAQTLGQGVVFASPVDGSMLMVQAGQTPQDILIQSAWVTANPGCQSDVEVQSVYMVSPNDTSVTGVPESVSADFQLVAP